MEASALARLRSWLSIPDWLPGPRAPDSDARTSRLPPYGVVKWTFASVRALGGHPSGQDLAHPDGLERPRAVGVRVKARDQPVAEVEDPSGRHVEQRAAVARASSHASEREDPVAPVSDVVDLAGQVLPNRVDAGA